MAIVSMEMAVGGVTYRAQVESDRPDIVDLCLDSLQRLIEMGTGQEDED